MDTDSIAAISETDTVQNQAEVSEAPAAEITSGSAQTEKTFTQKELDDIVRNRLERARKDMPSKEELEEFKNWKNVQKEFEQKALDDIAAANSAKESAERDRRALEIRVSCLSKGISPEYADDVIALAEKYAGDDIPMDKAIDSVISRYPVFCGKACVQAASGITTGIRTQTAPSNSKGTANFFDVIRENQVKRQ